MLEEQQKARQLGPREVKEVQNEVEEAGGADLMGFCGPLSGVYLSLRAVEAIGGE